MPGRTPHDAFSAFLDPLAEALKCVARVKPDISPGGSTVANKEHSITLTGRDGYVLLQQTPGRHRLQMLARMRYMIVLDDREGYGPYRVKTRAYDYAIERQDGMLVVAYHWHPVGTSHVTTPHMHIGSTELRDDAVLNEKAHYPTGRITFEAAVATAIGQLGARPLHQDWKEILAMCEEPHIRHRSWHHDYEAETGEKVV